MVSLGLKILLKTNSHDCSLALILESGWLRTSLSMSGFRDKQRTLVNTVGGMQQEMREHAKNHSRTLLWPKFTHKYCEQKEIIKYQGKVPVDNNKK
jgi:hypothetical protein